MATNPFAFADTPAPPAATPQEGRDSGLLTPAPAGAGSFAFADTPSPAPRAPEPTQGFSFADKPPVTYGAPIGPAPTVAASEVDPEKQSWIGKAWDWVNSPIIDASPITRLTGWTPESGWGKGLLSGSEDLIRGLTSPLSLAFLIGTLGTGGLIEGAGSAALRTAGMGLGDALEVTKGSKIIASALRAGKTTEEAMQAVEAAGINAQAVTTGLAKLSQAGLTSEALTSRGLIQDAGSALLRRVPGLSIAQADNVSTGINALINAGFTAQNAYSAALTAPRVFDALKEGDYEDAARYAVDAVGSGAFAGLGAVHGVKTAGHFMPELAAKLGLRNSPSQENTSLINEFGKRDAAVVRDQRAEKLWEQNIRAKYPELKPDDLHRVMKWVMSGESEDVMRQRYNSLAEAAGVNDRIGGEEAGALAARSNPWISKARKEGFHVTRDVRDTRPEDPVWALPDGTLLTSNSVDSHGQLAAALLGNADVDFSEEEFSTTSGAARIGLSMGDPSGSPIIEVHVAPTDAQLRQVADFQKMTGKPVKWDLWNEETHAGGEGSMGDLRRAVEKTWPETGRLAARRKYPSIDDLVDKYGKTYDLKETAFIAPDGTGVRLAPGTIHDQMLGATAKDNAREGFINDTGTIRTRFRTGRGGDELVVSLPTDGITEEQASRIRSAAGPLRNGNMVLEEARPGGNSQTIEFPTASKIHDAIESLVGIKAEEPGALAARGGILNRPEATHEDQIQEALRAHKDFGGSTFNVQHGNMAGRNAYAVSIFPERTLTLDHPPTAEELRAYDEKNADLLKDPRTSRGTWHDTSKAPAPVQPELVNAANRYNRISGLPELRGREYIPTDPRAPQIADAYERMRHEPNNPAVRKSYQALTQETRNQWNYAAKELGIKFEPWDKPGQPYANSDEMMQDVARNKHLYFFKGGDLPADHPMAQVDPKTGYTYNEEFRAVHDLFGHAAHGYQFGARGEENAWNAHSQMFSKEALPALMTETKAQNSWVNNRNLDKPVAERPFGEQKAGLLPAELQTRPPAESTGEHVLDVVATTPNRNEAIELGKRYNQKAVGDLRTMQDIPTGGTGEALKNEIPEAQRLDDISKTPRGSTTKLLERPLDVENPTVENIGAALEKYTTGKSRLPAMSLAATDPADMTARAVRLGTSELQRQLAEENSGREWYGKNIDTMVEEMAKLHPELKDPVKAGFFKSLVAAASLGNDSPSTMSLVDQMYRLFKEDGKIPIYRPDKNLFGDSLDWGGNYPGANRAVLENIQSVLDHVGGDPDKAYQWLMEKHPVSELREVKGRAVSGKATDMKEGGYALGPKAGPFFLNMNGVETALTMDKWAARTWNRWMGTLIDPDGSVHEAPRSQAERDLMKEAVDQIAKPFGLTTREAQAVLWYYEQNLWKAHGLDIESGVSYGDAAKKYVVGRIGHGPSGELAGEEEGDTGFEPGELAARGPVWYLKSERAIADKMPNKASTEQVRGILNSSGIKADELKWTGLDDFLKGKEKVSKQEVQDYLRENNVQVKEVLHDDSSLDDLRYDRDQLVHKLEARGYYVDEREGYFDIETPEGKWLTSGKEDEQLPPDIRQDFQALNENAAARGRKLDGEKSTKFGAHVLPGGQNYRELLLTLPTERTPPWRVVEKGPNDFDVVDSTGKTRLNFSERRYAQDVVDRQSKNGLRADNAFTGGHFDEPNVLAHVRFNDRVDAEGKKVLFLEEVQSDWHQKGRKQGYQDSTRVADLEKQVVDIDKRMQAIQHPHTVQDVELIRQWRKEGLSDDDIEKRIDSRQSGIESALKPLRDQREPLSKELYAAQRGVPDAPFKKDWHELALRRMLRYAAENGYDKLAWTTGEQQSERYDLSTRVKSILYDENTHDLKVYGFDGEDRPPIMDVRVEPAKLEDYIGKEASQRLLSSPKSSAMSPYRLLEGENLKVGGSGMKGFYDKMLPDFLNKYGKKWGAKVGETEVRTKEGQFEGGSLDRSIRAQHAAGTPGLEPAIAAIEKGREYSSVPSIDITPAMHDSVMQGQPLFARTTELAARLKPENWKDATSSYIPAADSRPGYVEMNAAGKAVLNHVLGESNWDAFTLAKPDMREAMHKLFDLRNDSETPENAKPAISRLIDTLQKADSSGMVVVLHPEGAGFLPHEFTHVHQFELGKGALSQHADINNAYDHADTAAAVQGLANNGYGKLTRRDAVAEIATHIITGDRDRIGLSQEQAASWLKNYLDGVRRLHGVEGVQKLLSEAVDAFKWRDEYDKVSETERQGRPDVEPQAGGQPKEGGGGLSERAGRSVGTEVGAGAGGDQGREAGLATRRKPVGGWLEYPDAVSLSRWLALYDRQKLTGEHYTDTQMGHLGRGLFEAWDADPENHQAIKRNAEKLLGRKISPADVTGPPPEPKSGALAARNAPRGTDEDRVRELIDQHLVQNSKHYNTPQKVQALLDSYDYRKLTPEQKALAAEVRSHFNTTLEKAQKAGALKDGVENYITQLWEKNSDNPAANRLRQQANHSEFGINTPMARHRLFSNAFEGELLGNKLRATDPIALAANNGAAFSDVINNRALFDRIQDMNIRASDGRPMLAPSVSGHVIEGEDGENPAVLVNPNTTRSIRIADQVAKGLEQSGDLKRMIDEGKISKLGKDKAGKDVYAWNPGDYFGLDHPGLRAWKFATQDTAGNTVAMKSDLKVHPEIAPYMRRRLGLEKSPLQESGLGKAALVAGREAKGSLLAWSPFHIGQEGGRALLTGISPFGIDRWSLDKAEWTRNAKGELYPANDDALLTLGVQNRLTLGPDYRGVESFQDGQMKSHSKIIGKVPGLGKLQAWMNSFLFDRYIPSLKSRAFKSLFKRYEAAYPDWELNKVAQKAAEDTNNRFGGINYEAMGRSVATQDLFRMVALAPDWLESEARFAGSMFGEGGKIPRRDVARLAIGMWAAARVLNYVVSGQGHYEAPFGVALKGDDGREKIYSVRSMPGDIMHMVSDPGGFLAGRVAPLAKSGAEAVLGVDEKGHKTPTHNIFLNVIKNAAPIAVQTAVKSATGEIPDTTTPDQIAKAAGLTVQPYATEAEKRAAKIASDRSESGPVDENNLRRHQAVLEMESRLRSGQMGISDLNQIVQQGQMAPAEAKKVMQNVQATQGMDPETARLWSMAERAPMKDFISIWSVASPEQHAALAKLLLRKKNSYIKKVMIDETPAERQQDATLQWILKSFPGQPAF